MSKRGWLLVAVTVAIGVLAVCGSAVWFIKAEQRAEQRAEKDCPAQLKADEAKIRTNRLEAIGKLPGVGDYEEIHWQVRAAGNPCSRAPGPTDWHYQGVLRLRPQDAEALTGQYDWQPVPASPSPGAYEWDTPAQIWPALAPFVPADARWLHSETYATTHFQDGPRWGDVYLDPANQLLFFVLYDH